LLPNLNIYVLGGGWYHPELGIVIDQRPLEDFFNMSNNLVTLRVWGDFACFTRPEMKVERVSYPVMTPSAARGVLEAVFWSLKSIT